MSTEMDSAPQRAPQAGATATAGETRPIRSPEEATRESTQVTEVLGPTLLPPSLPGSAKALADATAATAVGATWHTGVTITAMWSINETRNVWIYVTGKGWRKIYNGRDGSFTALTALAGQARQTKRTVWLREEADGMIYEIYLW